jgi:hypothetical protein
MMPRTAGRITLLLYESIRRPPTHVVTAAPIRDRPSLPGRPRSRAFPSIAFAGPQCQWEVRAMHTVRTSAKATDISPPHRRGSLVPRTRARPPRDHASLAAHEFLAISDEDPFTQRTWVGMSDPLGVPLALPMLLSRAPPHGDGPLTARHHDDQTDCQSPCTVLQYGSRHGTTSATLRRSGSSRGWDGKEARDDAVPARGRPW